MTSTDAPPLNARREALRTGWIVLLSLLTLIPLAVWRSTLEPSTPAEVVESFFTAVLDKDLDKAYSYVDASIPVGQEAAFLHPDAIGDEWELLDVREHKGGSSWETAVTVTVGHPDGIAKGRYSVKELHGELSIADPFETVALARSSQLAVRVNDRVVEQPLSHDDLALTQSPRYKLLPGVYRFYGGEPVALLDPEASEVPVIQPPAPEPTSGQVEAVQTAVEALIDACVEYSAAAPPGCPFATDGEVDTADRERLSRVEDLVWTVSEYPKTTVVPGVDIWGQPMLLVGFDEPGLLELSGTGSAGRDQWKAFTAACRFGGEGLVVLLHGDDGVELRPVGAPATDTCRGTA